MLVDTNVVLDLLLAREPFVREASGIFALAEASRITAYLCATTVTTVDYLLTRSLPGKESKKAIRQLLRLFEVAPVNRVVLEGVLEGGIPDFEDAVLAEAGLLAGCDVIVTRNTTDFRGVALHIVAPDEFLAQFPGRKSTQP